MKLTLVFSALSPLLALAIAQDASETTTSLTPQASCAAKCAKTDTCCIAGCYRVPCPDDAMANRTNQCVADCPQNEGQDVYISCQNNCFSSHFFPATWTGNVDLPTNIAAAPATATLTGTGTGTGASAPTNTGNANPTTAVQEIGSASKTESNASETSVGSGSGFEAASGSATASGSAAATPTHKDSGAAQLGASVVGAFGLVLAALAL